MMFRSFCKRAILSCIESFSSLLSYSLYSGWKSSSDMPLANPKSPIFKELCSLSTISLWSDSIQTSIVSVFRYFSNYHKRISWLTVSIMFGLYSVSLWIGFDLGLFCNLDNSYLNLYLFLQPYTLFTLVWFFDFLQLLIFFLSKLLHLSIETWVAYSDGEAFEEAKIWIRWLSSG